MLLSIIVPHFNSHDGLLKLLDSIPIRDDIEVIIVDDRSDESSLSVLRGNNICYFTNEGKKGAGACRNIGIKRAKGKYVIFADSDDYFVSDAFRNIDDVMFGDSDYDVVYFSPVSACAITGEESDRHVMYCNLINDYLSSEYDKTILYDFVVPWSKLILKSFIDDNSIKFDEVIASNDVMFAMKLNLLSKNIGVSKENIYCVTRGKGTLTVTRSLEVVNSRFSVEKSRIKFIIDNNLNVETNSFVRIFRLYSELGFCQLFCYAFSAFIRNEISFLSPRHRKMLYSPKFLIRYLLKDKSINKKIYKA
ncbi:TPA: glycosyltransferase family A protein [Vibrio vulnificus]|nr:glycosyltransferase [Vibrio vulnificus]HAT8526046.1 glycosyltransferase [Vibrio vulnificus]HDY7648747.1 glycosyltransferase family 2 protein [Vibrio vulnificus]